MNSKFFGTGLAALALLASSFSAQAADIPPPVYKGARAVVAYYNWTGFYAGINAGYGFGTSDWSIPAGTRVKKCAAATTASIAAKTAAPPSKPNPASVATKSPSAVPSVFDTRIVTQ